MRYNVIATKGRTTMRGNTTHAMWALLKAGQDTGRDFIRPFWDEMVRSTIFESARWSGHGTTEKSCAVPVQALTQEWQVTAIDGVAQVRADTALRRVEEEVQQGLHDSTQGLRPTSVFRDQEGAICVSYPSGPGWIAWERKVSY